MIIKYKFDLYNYLLLWLLFTATAPFYFHLAIPNHPYKWFVFLGILLMVARLVVARSFSSGNKVIVSILLFQTCYSIIAALLQETLLGIDLIYLNLSIQLIAVLIVYIYTSTFFNVNKLAISTIYVISTMGILGVIAFVLGIFGVLKPINMFPLDAPRYTNFILTFSNAYSEIGNSLFIRVAGFFDEPGSFAYFITMALLVNKLYDYSKKLEMLLIFVGVFTFSLGFIISMLIYYIFFYFRLRNFKKVSITILSVFLLVFMIDELKDDNIYVNYLHELTLSRLSITNDGSSKIIEGDNRSQKLIWSKEAFIKSPIIGHGMSAYSNPNSEFYGKLCCNILDPLATHGIVGTLIFFALFIYWFFIIITHSKIDAVSLGAFIIVFVNFFQRPGFHGGLFGYFIYIFLVEATIWRHQNKLLLTVNNQRNIQISNPSSG